MTGGLKSIAALTISMLALTGCQVQPLHSTAAVNSGNESISEALQSIAISEPKTRLDQLVRNELQFSLSGGAQPDGTLPYTLLLTTTKSVRSVGISDVDFGPRAFFVTVSASYVLNDGRLAAPIAQGTQEGTASYDRVDQEFTNLRSERDAEIRAAKTAALKIRQALAVSLDRLDN